MLTVDGKAFEKSGLWGRGVEETRLMLSAKVLCVLRYDLGSRQDGQVRVKGHSGWTGKSQRSFSVALNALDLSLRKMVPLPTDPFFQPPFLISKAIQLPVQRAGSPTERLSICSSNCLTISL